MTMGKLANFGFRQLRFDQRTSNFEFRTGFAARAIVSGIIQIVAVDDISKSTLNGHFMQSGVEVLFAEITAVCWVCRVVRVAHLARIDDFVAESVLLNKARCDSALVGGVAGTLRSHRQCGVSELSMRDESKV